MAEVKSINLRLLGRGVNVMPLRFDGGRALIYVYRPERLKEEMTHCIACLEIC